MSIVAMQRVTLIGLVDRKRETLRRLQALGVMHVDAPAVPEAADRRESLELHQALTYLLACPHRRRLQRPADTPGLGELLETIHTNRRRREDLIDRLTLLRRHRRALAPWGDFHFPPLEALGGQRLWFYRVPLGKHRLLEALDLPWQVVNRDHRELYLVVIAPEEPTGEQVPFARSHTGSRSLTAVDAAIETARSELEDLDAERFMLTRWIVTLAGHVAQAADTAELLRIMRASDDTAEALFVIHGWVPRERLPALVALDESGEVALLERPPADDEEPPVLLDNPEWLAGGEEAVKFFQLPGYRSADPSAMVGLSFALFFAIILADAGYALVFGALVALARPRWKRSRTGRRLGRLGLAMSAGGLLYGVLVGSYFGVAPPPHSWAAGLAVMSMDDFGGMMRLSITIGVCHLIAGNALAARHARPRRRALSNGGWILMLASGFGLWLSLPTQAPRLPWLVGLILGAVLVLLFTRVTPRIDGWRPALQRLIAGLTALGSVTQAFGHALSYMRLFALGLASASLAVTFNQLAVDVRDAVAGAGPLLFVLILLLGHALNFALALMGGVVHGLRLNLIEFLRWGVTGEGRPYQAFANQEESTWIK
ncbi:MULTISPECIES: V-type ATP synthase subunit I [unclassified Modicisalibacter]|uniref:V-type ATP synthase subunit I n=1 Tax=unclassified Modicisalibacter TaxID=2679913 RepID=UPI001CCDEE8A|nr:MULTISPECIES: V-type ATP synthase subunit I [unclassified Modicisalibacter]MBZ9558402.1 V-type ATP synthase subunit I [Modicisalibacter sp. R2A 31.J]MBZ9575706.1 V-type ATP synthase subunit I [Modicisalibacter sp. MOD 31.J]